MKTFDVVIITDFEEGHLFPLFKVASNLVNNGLDVCFVGIADTMQVVRENGFNHYTILTKLFPEGYVQNLKKNKIKTGSISPEYYLQSFFGELEILMPALNPKVIFSSHFFVLEALIIHHRFKVHQVVFHLMLPALDNDPNMSLGQQAYHKFISKVVERNENLFGLFVTLLPGLGGSVRNVDEIVSPLKTIPHVVLCPGELEIRKTFSTGRDIYLGPCINLATSEKQRLFLSSLEARTNKKIIFASMGSQTKEYLQNALKAFRVILEGMKSVFLQDFHLVMSLGSESSDVDLGEISENVSVFAWVPQLAVLQKASMAIIHGGLGSIKECIYFGVPMLVIPMGRDQLDNAKRVEHHNIGLVADIDHVCAATIAEKMQVLSADRSIWNSMNEMKNVFQKANTTEKEVELVRAMLA